MKQKLLVLVFVASIFTISFFAGRVIAKEGKGVTKFFKFDEDNALKEWTEKIFKGKVFYNVEQQKGESFIHALSQGAASGFYYRVRISTLKYPMLSWKWKVTKFPQAAENGGSASAAKLDDFAARMYVIFPSGSFRTSRCVEYVWDEFLPAGTVMDSAWGKNIKMIVVRSGAEKDAWFNEERNIYEDFKKAFGYYTKLDIGAVAFMTDTDSTGGTAEAYYDDIKIGYSK